MILLAAVLAAAGAPPPDAPAAALSPVALRFWEEGRALEADGRWEGAALRYRAVRTADPAFGPAALALARVLASSGDPAGAEAVLRERPFDADAVEALGELLASAERWSEAALVRRALVGLRPEWPGARVLQAEALVHVDPAEAAGVLGDYLSYEGIDPAADGLLAVTATVADALRDSGRRSEAAELVGRALAVDPTGAEVLAPLLVRIEVDLEADALAQAGDTPLLPEGRTALRAAREAFARGETDAARRALEVLVLESPASAAAWGALAAVREAQGDPVGAELACRTAERLDPRSAEWPALRGELLGRWFAGRYDTDAVAAYARALRRRPEDAELWFRRGEAERRAGRWQEGAASMGRALALDPHGPRAAEAARVVEGAGRVRAAEPEVTSAEGRPPVLSEDAWRAFLRASAWRERSEPWASDEALAELRYVRLAAPGFRPAAALEAELHSDRGDWARAEAGWDAILSVDPADAEANARRAALAERDGDGATAEALWARAAASGHPGALMRRARAEAAGLRWWTARATLAEYLARASTGAGLDEARALDAELARRIRLAWIGAALAVAGLASAPLVARWRRRAGADLEALVARSPGAARDLARLLAAVRHEVVKHHFGLLDAVADALDDRDPDAARFAADRWFGAEGALARLDGYVAQLEALGRSAGVRLNLRWRDPRFGPLLAAVDELRRLEGALRTGAGPALADSLRSLSGPLGRDAHAALGALIDALCVLPVDEAFLRAAHARAAAEVPARRVPPPVSASPGGAPVRVRMFRTELEDVVVNLVRNALAATPDGGELTLGLSIRVEVDPVTFLERAVVTVADHAPGRLTTRELRSRHVSRGLGLVTELVARAGGSVAVEAVPGYAKGVVVRLPRVEEGA